MDYSTVLDLGIYDDSKMHRFSLTEASSLHKQIESQENEDNWTNNAFYEDESNNAGNLQNLYRMPRLISFLYD